MLVFLSGFPGPHVKWKIKIKSLQKGKLVCPPLPASNPMAVLQIIWRWSIAGPASPGSLEVLVVSSCPPPVWVSSLFISCTLGQCRRGSLVTGCPRVVGLTRGRGGSDLLEEHHLGKAPCLYEGLVVGRSYWMRRQNCILKRGILINEQMGK